MLKKLEAYLGRFYLCATAMYVAALTFRLVTYIYDEQTSVEQTMLASLFGAIVYLLMREDT